ncbi:hypothetical protein RJ641_034391 [Dillenia turbinata]|uniref:Uncharacterized protein n=1 Tax=Dillenia turbinata TaxID=194707 RepID=A0AAN8VQK4_9MAGN
MGSSRRKPSSSLKKKRSKSSSKKKSRRSKSKKLRHHSNSSSYSDDSTRSSGSDSFSSSEDEYRIKDKKGSRKRSRKSSSTNRDSRRSRRRDGSKRVDDSGSKKKSSKPHKKKPRREPSISSASSKSCSCSESCRGSDSREERKPLMRRGMLEGKVKSRGNLSRGRSETKRIRSRSPSYSPSRSPSRSPTYSSSYLGEDVTVENNSKRLRSVITVVKHEEETAERERDKEEEIIYDRDDYPSRSNDSNDGGIKEPVYHSEVVFDKKGLAEDKKFIDDLMDNGSTAVVEGGRRDVAMQNIGSNITIDVEDKHINLKKSSGGMSNAVNGLGSDDLESVLRQRALENLRKFRGGVQAGARSPNDPKDSSDAKVASPRHVLVQTKSGKEAAARVTVITKTAERSAEVGKIFTPGESVQSSHQSRMIFNGNPRRIDNVARFGDNSESVAKPGGDNKEFKQCTSAFARELSQRNLIQKQESVNRKSSNILPANNSVNASSNQSSQAPEITCKEGVRGLVPESSLTHLSMKQVHTLPEKPKTVLTKNMVNKNADQSSQAKPLSCNSLEEKANNTSIAAAMPPSSSKSDQMEQTSSGQKEEAKEGSQFQQKTMSVMRGGEMVQVSYKVYIPKKAPALARRKLQR